MKTVFKTFLPAIFALSISLFADSNNCKTFSINPEMLPLAISLWISWAVIAKRARSRIIIPTVWAMASNLGRTFLPRIDSIPIKASRPPSRAGKGIMFRMARLTDRIPTKLISASVPIFAASEVIAKIPTGPARSFGACPANRSVNIFTKPKLTVFLQKSASLNP